MRTLLSLSAAIGLTLLVGCESPQRSNIAAGGLEQRALGNAAPDAVLIEAAAILKREFGRAKINPEMRSIETGYYEYSTSRESGTSRDLVGGRSQMRRKATFVVGSRGETTVARLRIDVERRDSEQQSVLQPRGARFGDSPGQESAIDRDAATTTSQNVVWTPVRRDYQLEKQLLAELQEKFTRLAAEDEAPPASPEAPRSPDAPEKGKANGQ
jgi:hypothetical protein